MAEEMYKASNQGGGAGQASGTDGTSSTEKKEDEPIEAEFREEKGR